jgi:hypothetical protein
MIFAFTFSPLFNDPVVKLFITIAVVLPLLIFIVLLVAALVCVVIFVARPAQMQAFVLARSAVLSAIVVALRPPAS